MAKLRKIKRSKSYQLKRDSAATEIKAKRHRPHSPSPKRLFRDEMKFKAKKKAGLRLTKKDHSGHWLGKDQRPVEQRVKEGAHRWTAPKKPYKYNPKTGI